MTTSGCSGRVATLLEKFLAVAIRQADVQQHQVERIRISKRLGFRQRLGTSHLTFPTRKNFAQQISDDRLVLDHKHFFEGYSHAG